MGRKSVFCKFFASVSYKIDDHRSAAVLWRCRHGEWLVKTLSSFCNFYDLFRYFSFFLPCRAWRFLVAWSFFLSLAAPSMRTSPCKHTLHAVADKNTILQPISLRLHVPAHHRQKIMTENRTAHATAKTAKTLKTATTQPKCTF